MTEQKQNKDNVTATRVTGNSYREDIERINKENNFPKAVKIQFTDKEKIDWKSLNEKVNADALIEKYDGKYGTGDNK